MNPLRTPFPLALVTALLVAMLAELGVVLVGPSGSTGAAAGAVPSPSTSAHRPIFAPARTPVLGMPSRRAVPTAGALGSALSGPSSVGSLGGRLAGVVVDAARGRVLYAVRAGQLVPPASTAKIATAVAALQVLDPATRLTTTAVRGRGAQVILVGGGDPALASAAALRHDRRLASIDALAAATARALRRARLRTVRLGFDTGRYAGPSTAPGWKPGYLTDGDVARISPLMVDGGRVRPRQPQRYDDPAAAAAQAFAGRLARYGIRVAGPQRPAHAQAGARVLALVRSPPIGELVEGMLTTSDNNMAEALAREVAGHYRLPRSFAGGVAGVRRAVAAAGIHPAGLRLVDGSGLSTRGRAQPRAIVALLGAAVRQPRLREVLTGLPVAGLTGTLATRFRRVPASSAAGVVRAKTGTLNSVNALAGAVLDRDGALLTFAFLAPGAAPRSRVQRALDRLAATLAGCGCR